MIYQSKKLQMLNDFEWIELFVINGQMTTSHCKKIQEPNIFESIRQEEGDYYEQWISEFLSNSAGEDETKKSVVVQAG